MTVDAKRLVAGSQLTAAAATYYTAPAATKAIIKAATLLNNTGGAVTVDVHLVPNGGSATAANRVLRKTLANDTGHTCPELVNQVLEAGGTIQALGLNVAMVVSGVELT